MDIFTSIIRAITTFFLSVATLLPGFGRPVTLPPSASPSASFATITKPAMISNFPPSGIFSVAPETNPPSHPPVLRAPPEGVGKPKSPDIGPPQTVTALPLSGTCTDRDRSYIQITLERALLIRDLPDLHTSIYDQILKANPDIGYDAFLIVQGQTKNTDPDKYEQLYEQTYARLRRGDINYGPIIGYVPIVNAYSTQYFASIFPVRADEKTFSLLFCMGTHPQVYTLDFTTPQVQTLYGTYNMTTGFQEIQK